VRIHTVGFPVLFNMSNGISFNVVRYAALMPSCRKPTAAASSDLIAPATQRAGGHRIALSVFSC